MKSNVIVALFIEPSPLFLFRGRPDGQGLGISLLPFSRKSFNHLDGYIFLLHSLFLQSPFGMNIQAIFIPPGLALEELDSPQTASHPNDPIKS
jgi:hypothetical protein